MIKSSLPFRICESKGFKDLLLSLNKNYKPPGKTKLTSIVNDLYNSKKVQIRLFLSDVKCFSLTKEKDIKNQIYYTCLTLHYIDNYKTFSVVLSTCQLDGDATSNNQEKFFRTTLEDWDIDQSKIVTFTTDGASNYVKAAKAITANVHCFAHRLNPVVQDGLSHEQLRYLINKVKLIVSTFKRSDILMRDLNQKRAADGNKQLKLIQDVITRWNSTFYLIERYNQLCNDISHVLLQHGKRDIDLSDGEILSIKELIDILRPFEQMTSDISGESYVTISRIIPLVSSMRLILAKKHPNDCVIKEVVGSLIRGIEKRFNGIESNKNFAYATLLDPRFKNIDFFSSSDCARMVASLDRCPVDPECPNR